jgi:uncharacterized membrane protein
MHLLDVLTILCTGLMIGNELALSLFINPALWQLDDQSQARALSLLARSLGKAMPPWYAGCLVLLIVEAYLRRYEPALTLLLVAIVLWIATIIYTVSTLVPINNRIAALTSASLPAQWRPEHKRWDTLHRWRILLLMTAMVCLTYGLLCSH